MAHKKSAKQPAKGPTKTAPSVSLSKKQLVIDYTDGHDLLDKLLTATQAVARFQTTAARTLMDAGAATKPFAARLSKLDVPDILGPSRAYDIVTNCAGESDPNKKLGDIPGLDLAIFQTCVQSGVRAAGYIPGNVPATATTTLWDVIQAIMGCGK